jgi:magnesium-protoporphyrin IX monomethyl ester (oxidative) cyclase
MVNTPVKPEIDEIRAGVKVPAKETILTPRFYTTDFDEMAKMDLSLNEDELRALVEELRADYNQKHFVRSEVFQRSWDHISGETRTLFIEFLERSCTAEFSGFLLYKELGRRLKNKNPLLAECFNLISRDEARHAGFLNKAMSDFKMSLDLGFLTKSRSYTFFKPKFILYATYLSEKIGYWRYITIFRHLESHPEDCIYPIFHFFENWCQDENRHGDFFDAVLRSQPQLLNDLKSRLWCRFFLLSVFATMYLNDLERSGFYATIGLDSREYDKHVIQKTNENAGRVFPVILDVDNPTFFQRMEVAAQAYLKLLAVEGPKALKTIKRLPQIATIGYQLLRLYLMKPINTARLDGTIR